MEEMAPLPDRREWPVDTREGRLGPATVCLDTTSPVGLFVVGADRLCINSQSIFSTIRANVCLYRGKMTTLEVLKPIVFHMVVFDILNYSQFCTCNSSLQSEVMALRFFQHCFINSLACAALKLLLS
jgi:hypothetical protein